MADNFSRFNFGSKGSDQGRLQEFLNTLPYANR
jgi:hypothetical protein